jgi:hypothetical protein
MAVSFIRETEKSTTKWAKKEDTELAFAAALRISPIDEIAVVCLHLLENHAKAKDEANLEELILHSQNTATSGAATLESVDLSISATISVEIVRGQRLFVLKVELEKNHEMPSESELGYFALDPRRST